jgi:hypothetical protein
MEINTTVQVFEALTKGRGTAKESAIRIIDSNPTSLDFNCLRTLIVTALRVDYRPPKGNLPENIKAQDTRCWLLSALGRISQKDKEALTLVKEHLDDAKEPYEWARYWALDGLVAACEPTLEEEARRLITKQERIIILSLAHAILARQGEDASLQFIRDNLSGDDPVKSSAALRALRIVPLLDDDIIHAMCQIVNKGVYSDNTFDAIAALGKLPFTAQQAEHAAQILTNYLINYRWPMHEAMRTKALAGLGNLKFERTTSVLIEELADDSPAIVSHAARALENVLGVQAATKRIFDTLTNSNTSSREFISKYANALRAMDRDKVVEELERIMVSSSESQQEIARALLSEVGGAQAFQRLSARTRAANQYLSVLEAAEAKVRELFETSLKEANHGFRVATNMDITVFIIGIILIGVSAGLALGTNGTLDNWTGVGITGGLGVLGVLYSILISNPRRQIRESVDHLMRLKVVFLGYLRQLHQADQAYTRRLLEDNSMSPAEVNDFSRMVSGTMTDAIAQLAQLGNTKEVKASRDIRLTENRENKQENRKAETVIVHN